jgi:opacity protein-like surface antigen
MIKNFMLQSVVGLSAFIACASYAEDKNYVQLSSGYSFAKPTGADVAGKKPKRGNVHSIELGRSVTDRVKIGLEFSHRSGYSVDHSSDDSWHGYLVESKKSKWSYKSSAVMVNLRCDVANLSGFTPYVLVGAGIAQNTTKKQLDRQEHFLRKSTNTSRSNKSTSLVYKIGAGVSYSVSQKIGIDIRYQFINSGKVRLHEAKNNLGALLSATRGKLKTNEVLIGLSYKF